MNLPLCENCSANGNLELCMSQKCQYHDTFFAKQMLTKIKSIKHDLLYINDDKLDHIINELMDKHYRGWHELIHHKNLFEKYKEMLSFVPGSFITEDPMVDICDHNWVDVRDECISSGELCLKCKAIREGNFLDVTFNDLPDYGDLMDIESFIGCCESGGFIDYDGHGNYALHDRMSNKTVHPSYITFGIIDKRFTHVVWFNR